ncbi:MAG: NmrA family NAD(P)-binding protein [Spirochaetales bacterium]|nr:NmrA family NAD(P)-binding protein [Spirochaetales bacterium]
MNPEILVIGALGTVGAETVAALLRRGVRPRAAGTDPSRVEKRFGDAVEPVRFDFGASETFEAAFAGISSMFVLRPPHISNPKRDMYPALEAARKAGVRRVVFLSLIGIEDNKLVPHRAVEDFLERSGQERVFLRCSFFMQNLGGVHRAEIRDRDELFLPVGDAKTSFIDARDLGEIAAKALVEIGTGDAAWDLTGSEALDYHEVARVFSRELGREIRYRNPSPLAFFLRRLGAKEPFLFALVTTWLYANTKRGMAARVTGEAERLLGREPFTLAEYVRDHRGLWDR